MTHIVRHANHFLTQRRSQDSSFGGRKRIHKLIAMWAAGAAPSQLQRVYITLYKFQLCTLTTTIQKLFMYIFIYTQSVRHKNETKNNNNITCILIIYTCYSAVKKKGHGGSILYTFPRENAHVLAANIKINHYYYHPIVIIVIILSISA